MKKLSPIFVLLCIIYAGVVGQKEYYPDGQLKSKTFQSRRKNIHWVYYPNGQLKYKRKINLKTNEKVTTVFYTDGTLKSILQQTSNDTGAILGQWQFFGRDGILECEQFQENGVFISTEHFRDYSTVDHSGEFKIEIIYKKGKWKGRGGNFTRIYNKNGVLINETPLDESQRIPESSQ